MNYEKTDDVSIDVTPTKSSKNDEIKVGDYVIANGFLYLNSNASRHKGMLSHKKTKVIKIDAGAKHPYNVEDGIGWMNAIDVKKA